ncbi:hypothetical protein EDD17DRAFT_1754998 [Pisolithus thermaeus]|nr:hypothetical protein EDD17DRAFT_1754998 [Pisolithus thermaeus]
MGQWMGIQGFNDHCKYLDLNWEMGQANHNDAKALHEVGLDGSILHGIFTGGHSRNTLTLEIPKTINSVNPNGKKLFRMHPYCEHNRKLEMIAWEMMELQTFTKELVIKNPLAGSDTQKHFYIKFQRSMLHPCLNPKHPKGWVKPTSLEAWLNSNEKMIKLDVLVKIIQHHLEKDGQCPLTTNEDGQNLIPWPDTHANIMHGQILGPYSIQAVKLNGSLTMKMQQSMINAFRKSTHTSGPQVLILSNVGVVGLNLACMNIMIRVDATLSALDDEQLKGQIFHYPQQKQVHFYQLITLHTPNVFLNNMSFDKGQLHNAFISAGSKICK